MTDAFEEVEESLRREKATQLWNRLWPWLATAVVALLVGVGGWEAWKWQRGLGIEKDANIFGAGMDALQANNFDAAKKSFAELGSKQGGFAVLADNMLAGIAAEVNKDNKAAGDALAAAAARDKGLAGRIATLKLAYLKADTDDLATLTKLVQPVVDGGGAESALARELLAAKALAGGDVERARRDFQQLQLDLDAPQEMKRRVSQILVALPAKPAAAPATATPAPAPATAPTTTDTKPGKPHP